MSLLTNGASGSVADKVSMVRSYSYRGCSGLQTMDTDAIPSWLSAHWFMDAFGTMSLNDI